MAGVLGAGGVLALTSRNWDLVRAQGPGLRVADSLTRRAGRTGLVSYSWELSDSAERPSHVDVAVALFADGEADGDGVTTHQERLAYWPFGHDELVADLRSGTKHRLPPGTSPPRSATNASTLTRAHVSDPALKILSPARPATPRRQGPVERMDNPDRFRRLRDSARPCRGRLERRAGAGLSRLLLVLAAVGVVLWPAGPALAHNQLVSATPDRNAVLRKTPTAVTLAFLQRLNPDFTTVVVSDAAKRPVPASAPTVKAKSATVALDQALGNGAYQVAYRVVSVDGHTVQGSYTFTVADPSRTAAEAAPSAAASVPASAPPASAPAVAVAPAAGSGGAPDGMAIALIGLGVVAAAGAGYLYVSRRRRAVAART